MSNGQKDTVYIDVDDEITSVIDKLNSSPHKIVALVLPKRAGVFQSIVNMKLLKRTADDSKKNVVLITSESALMPLAGAVGLHVAPNLQSRPEIPPPPSAAKQAELDNIDKTKSVGELAGSPSEDESLEVDNSDKTPAPTTKKPKAPGKDGGAKSKKLKIPNFEKFRLRLLLAGVAVLLLIVGWVLAFMVLPRATVTLSANTSELDLSLNFTADTSATELDVENRVLPAKGQEHRVTDSEKVPATGQKDLGTKASGTVSLQNCSESTGSITVPKGTSVSTGNLTFLTQQAVNLPESSFNGSGDCKTSAKNVKVAAEQSGEQYNLSSGKNFSVSGYSDVEASNPSSFSGGTSKIVKVVTQGDVDTALQRIHDRANNNTADELKDQLSGDGYYPLDATLATGEPTVTTSPNVGDEANEITVTSATTYTMVGVKRGDLERIIEADANEQIDTSAQVILNDGLGDATISVREAGLPPGQVPLTLATKVVAGPNIDQDAIKREIAGKGENDIKELLQGRPGIKDVEVSFSPFWVGSAPKSTGKITIDIQNATDADN